MRFELETLGRGDGNCQRRLRQYSPKDEPRACVASAAWKVRTGTMVSRVCERHLLEVLRSLRVHAPAAAEEGEGG